MKVLRILKVISINVISFLVLLFVVNWLCGKFLKDTRATRDQLPNYEGNREHAKAVFHDYNSLKFEYYPFVGWKSLPYKGSTTTVNQQGNREHTPPAYDGERTASVHFFGGSTMWGEGSDDQHTIPALFNGKFPEYNVVNHGQLAYNTRQEVDALISLYSKKVFPDVVVFYDGVNDAAFLCPSEINELPAHRLVPMFRNKIYVPKSAYVKEALYKAFLENIILLMNRYREPAKGQSPYDCVSNPEKAEEIAEMFMLNWEMAHQIVTSRGGRFIAILQPAALFGNPKTDHLKIDDDLKANFSDIYTRIQKKIAERGHPWIFDLSDVLNRDEYIYIDWCHVSPNGNAIVAEHLADIFRKMEQAG